MVVKFSIAHSLLFFLFPAPLIEIVVLNRFGDVTQPYRQFLKFPLCCIESNNLFILFATTKVRQFYQICKLLGNYFYQICNFFY